MKAFFSLLLVLASSNLFCGMDFILISENESDSCEMHFPDGLAYFVERVGAYGEKSEFNQIEMILDINLDVFNHLKYSFSEDGEPLTNWFNIDSTLQILNDVLLKIDSNKNFYKHVIFDSTFKNKEELVKKQNSIFQDLVLSKLALDKDSITEKEFNKNIEKLSSLELTYPVYDDYLEKGSFINDLKEFISIIICTKNSGNKKFGIYYS